MKDIVDELQAFANKMEHCMGGDTMPRNFHVMRTMATNAAAEIECLRTELAEAKAAKKFAEFLLEEKQPEYDIVTTTIAAMQEVK